ncbi:MAG: hypothetical protein U0807_11010 [Candidatus Binatia bacterium]
MQRPVVNLERGEREGRLGCRRAGLGVRRMRAEAHEVELAGRVASELHDRPVEDDALHLDPMVQQRKEPYLQVDAAAGQQRRDLHALELEAQATAQAHAEPLDADLVAERAAGGGNQLRPLPADDGAERQDPAEPGRHQPHPDDDPARAARSSGLPVLAHHSSSPPFHGDGPSRESQSCGVLRRVRGPGGTW